MADTVNPAGLVAQQDMCKLMSEIAVCAARRRYGVHHHDELAARRLEGSCRPGVRLDFGESLQLPSIDESIGGMHGYAEMVSQVKRVKSDPGGLAHLAADAIRDALGLRLKPAPHG